MRKTDKRATITVVYCDDNPDCIERFRSGSDASVIDAQLRAAGWEVVGSGARRTDVCPYHKHARTGPLTMEQRYGRSPREIDPAERDEYERRRRKATKRGPSH